MNGYTIENRLIVSGTTTVYDPGFYAINWPKQEQAKPMRGLYEVFIIDPFGTTTSDGVQTVKPGEIVYTRCIVADDESGARMKAVVRADLNKDVDDYDVLVRKIGNIRVPEKK